ncbi:MAG: PaaI family thioesterase [Clostridiales bacterium]|nr:PaaI family thioesterase [Clostridiales bacterium]
MDINMPTLEEIKTSFAHDRFAVETTGVEIAEAEPGHAVCKLKLCPGHLNKNGVPMGGALFTLADFAYAVASNAYSESVIVSQQADIAFLAPAKGEVLTAEASCIREGRRICLYEVRITDDTGVLVAYVTVNGYKTTSPKETDKGKNSGAVES